MALLSVIRRWHYREGRGIREIARRTGLARNTVRKYLTSDVIEPNYPARKNSSQLDDYADQLTAWLVKESKRSRKQRRNLKELHKDLVALGYSGSYDRVAAFKRQWRQSQPALTGVAGPQAFVPLSFEPGDAFQFDWSEDYVTLAGVSTVLYIAHFKLCHSRAFVLRAYRKSSHEMLFDAHGHAFRVWGGIPRRGLYDNMKTAVDKIGRGKHRDVNKRFEAMASHYVFEPVFCNPAAGWEKGQVEKGVQDSRAAILRGAPGFASLAEFNSWLERRCQEVWQTHAHPDKRSQTIAECWEEERSCLMAVPALFDGYVEHRKRVSSTCLITFERNRYSVPGTLAQGVVNLHVYADRLVVIADHECVAEHPRAFVTGPDDPGKTIYNWRHYLCVVQRKPGALRNGDPFIELPTSFKRLQAVLLKRPGGDRDMVDILALVLIYDEALVNQAVSESLSNGQPSKEHVLNCLYRLIDVPPPDPLTPPPTLQLTHEPVADSTRYDQLREVSHDG